MAIITLVLWPVWALFDCVYMREVNPLPVLKRDSVQTEIIIIFGVNSSLRPIILDCCTSIEGCFL